MTGQEISSISIHPIKPHIFYVTTERGVFKTLNAGKGWKKIFITSEEVAEGLESEDSDVDEAAENPKAVNWIELDPLNPEVVYLGTEDGLFLSENGGSFWKKLSEEGLLSNEIRSISVHPEDPNLLYAATRKGVFRFSKELSSWQEVYSGITARDIRSLAFNKKENLLWAATDKGVFKIDLGGNPSEGLPIKEMTLENIMTHFAHEPTIRQIQEAAIRYAEVIDPERIENLRKGARFKAILPDLDLDYDKTISYSGSNFWVGPYDWGIGLSWDLGDLIFSEQQRLIDSQVRLMVKLRDDILDEVTRLYFERRRLQVDLLLEPPKDLEDKLKKELRLQELTADIDALTGGYLSRSLSKG